jgi:hypothetical protein
MTNSKIRKAAKKRKTPAQEAQACAESLQLLVRLKAANDEGYCRCVTCGTTKHYKDGMQGGHFIERGKSATKLLEENIHPQCCGCNKFKMKTASVVLDYEDYMVQMYGREGVERLKFLSRQPHKWDRGKIHQLHSEIKEQIKYHKARLGEI